MQKEQWNQQKWVQNLIWKIGVYRLLKTYPTPKNAPGRLQEVQNWHQCMSFGPTNWFWPKKTKFKSVTSNLCSSGSESAMVGELLGVKLSDSDDIFIILDWNLNHGFISISTSTELTKAHPTCLSSVQMMWLDELSTRVYLCKLVTAITPSPASQTVALNWSFSHNQS